MVGHWRFLELSLPTPDIAASLEFYRCLGFTELTTTDARDYPYVVLSDGRIAIGLHAEPLPGPALSFVQPNVANWARQLEAAGFDIERQRLGVDDFHEFTLAGPSGHRVTVIEAATFSRPQIEQAPAPLTGSSACIELGCSDLEEGEEFWRLAGLESGGPENEDSDGPARDAVELAAPSVRLRLTRYGTTTPRLHFSTAGHDAIAAAAERFGLALQRRGDYWELTAPEGTVLELLVSTE